MEANDTRGSDRERLADPGAGRSNCGVGAVVDLAGGRDHDVVRRGLELLRNLEHRGARGAEPDTGDGAGIMVQRPDEFLDAVVPVDLPERYAVGSVFLPRAAGPAERVRAAFEAALAEHDLEVFHWRSVPTDAADLGETARASEPDVVQPFVRPTESMDDAEFDRTLYVARRAAEGRVEDLAVEGTERFYVCSLDRRRLVYKGLLTAEQLPAYYPDLTDERLTSTLALVHARFSTNTLGAWHLAHPYRNVIHNGEINTIRGNVNWLRSRETDLEHPDLDVETVRPVIADPEQSDTASVDNALDLLLAGGRSLPHALRMLIPEAFRGDEAMPERRRAWYDYHASLVEPWDGPALVVGTDGERVAAVLDRNGLRPCRYDVTTDDTLIMASEVGALDVDPAEVRERGRLKPGQLFVADPTEGRVIPDDEVFDDLTDPKYGEWVEKHQRHVEDLTAPEQEAGSRHDPPESLRARQAAFGYTHDGLEHLLEPMVEDGADPVGSMGDDTPLSVLADHDRPLFTYFKQLFAQVSNPPLDYIREELVTSLESRLGPQRNLLDETPEHARQLVLDSPVLTEAETEAIRDLDGDGPNEFESAVVDLTYRKGGTTLEAAVERVRADARRAIEDGAEVVVLSDRALSPERVAVPSLLATGAVHHHLVRDGTRNRAGLVIESGEPREVHHLATLVGYGADGVTPYLAYETIREYVRETDCDAGGEASLTPARALSQYRTALEDGLLKTMAKMGISTVESYQGAQIFEAVGLDSGLVTEYFEGTEIRTEGIGIEQIEADLLERHAAGFGEDPDPDLERQGEFEHRTGGLHHQWNPDTVHTLQQAVRDDDYQTYQSFATLINDQSRQLQTLRGLLEFDSDRDPVPLSEVEPVESIVERFQTAAMSLGSLSPEAHENNAVAMNRIGGKSNTGEGGEPPERFDTERRSKIKQVASGRFGVTSDYLADADEIQIKMAQGSKPGEGGHLPGRKVNEMIAHVRYATPGVGLISPPPLHDIYSIEDLKQLIHDLTVANPEAGINVKLVSEAGIGTIAAGVAKANADAVHVSGHSGGTGASPKTSIKNAGLPWELGLAETTQTLRETGLRDRIRVSTDGGLKTGRDVAVAALLGAEEFVFGTASLVTAGCVMARICHTNNCPTGVATQKEELRDRFAGEPEHVINYMTFLARELREIMADLGFRTVEEMVGRPTVLTQRETDHEKARHLDLSAVVAEQAGDVRQKVREQRHDGLAEQLDRDLLARPAVQAAIETGEPTAIERSIDNSDRAVGALLSNRISADHGTDGLADDTLTCSFRGTAGQSFGAFLQDGVTMTLSGAANDYLGKGLSGGKLVIRTPERASYTADENVLVGNVALYGATQGEAYVNGAAGERFAVRNSGVRAVVERVGDHGCEYMTGGVVAVLGGVGRNFAAGMSGGIAYVYDPDDRLHETANTGMVTLSNDLTDADRALLERLVRNHRAYTGSERAADLLADWEHELGAFTRVMPDAYAAVLEERSRADVRRNPPPPAEESGAGDGAAAVPGDD